MECFDKYVFNYDMKDPDISYKYYHCYRVMEIMGELANELNLSEEDIELAKIIGLLHDIGRFEQDKLFNSFIDGKFDHGDYAVKILKELNFLSYFNLKSEDYEVVYKAIKNHNKFAIEENLNERELLFSQLIRDADKLDILYVLGSKQFDRFEQDTDEPVSEAIKKNFYDNELGSVKEVKTQNDKIIISFTYIFDIYFKETYQLIHRNQYYDKIYARINRKDIFKEYIDYVNAYLEERSKKHVR